MLQASHFDKVVGAGDFRVVFDIKRVIKLQTDLKTFLQINAILALRAFGVCFWEISTGYFSRALRVHILIALHCNYKHNLLYVSIIRHSKKCT